MSQWIRAHACAHLKDVYERMKDGDAVFINDKNKVYITTGLVDSFELISDNYQMGLALYK